MQNLLPFEKIERKILIKKESETNQDYGKNPNERSVEELIKYGVININKPQGPTSHLVSDYVQRILKITKAGHSGSLDPNVTGCLPIALEDATRIVHYLLKSGKEYVCLMHLHADVTQSKIHKIMQSTIGKIKQLPPIKSAVKRQLREREIYYLEILEIDGKDVLFKIGCEAGTYIRKYCLAPETEIITSNGIKTIEDIYKNKDYVSAYSYKKGKIVKNSISDHQKIPFSGNLIEIITSSGIPIKVTPDHKLLTSNISGSIMKKARYLKVNEFLFRSIKIYTPTKRSYIAEFLDDNYLIHNKKLKDECKKILIKRYKSIRNFSRKTGINRQLFIKDSKIDLKIKHVKLAGIFNKVKKELNCFKTEKGKIIKVNPNLSKELLYLMGLIASDGNNTKEKNTVRYTRIKFHNNELFLINKFHKLVRLVFPNIKVTKKVMKGKLWQVETSNSLFATVCANLGITSPSKKSDIYKILELDNVLISSFLKGYFDGDGTAFFKIKDKVKGAYSTIRYISVDFKNIKRIHQMLLKLGIQSKIFKKNLNYSKIKTNNEFIYLLNITDPASKVKFSKIIGSEHPRKKEILKRIKKYFRKLKNHPEDYLYSPMDKLVHLDKKLHSKISSRIFTKRIPITRYIYQNYISKNLKLKSNLEEFTIEKIKSVRKIPFKGFVYDITVENDHNFLIENGLVSSNCHDVGKLLGTNAHMQQLVRTKAGPFTDKDWHSMQDLKDAYEYYQEGNEKEIKKIILPFELAASHLPKIWVMDSTVDSLCHGAQLSIPGISKLHSNIKKDDVVAIMTLKEELICVGTAILSSEEIIKNEKGLAIKNNAVFMQRKTYPKHEHNTSK